MNDTERSIVKDLAEHEGATPAEIAGRVCCTAQNVRHYLGGSLSREVVRISERRGRNASTWGVSDNINWCAHCGQVIR